MYCWSRSARQWLQFQSGRPAISLTVAADDDGYDGLGSGDEKGEAEEIMGVNCVDVIDELGQVPADLFHADALRKTYGHAEAGDLGSDASKDPKRRFPSATTSSFLCESSGGSHAPVLRASAGS